uniref:Circadian-associated transcriptional repressor n=1 Tax=Junco hyemalis TaxID=40217 RepID=A0A8C5IY96_JUNHY
APPQVAVTSFSSLSWQCRELRGFIRPLAELLEGLRRGRYDRGLSSFQQSVAMDRLQRIIGVLQKPEMGARYLGTLLQVEAMLRLWFPHVAPKPALDSRSPLPAGTGPSRACAFPRRLGGNVGTPPSGEGPEPALLEAINAAGAAGASRCRVLCARWGGGAFLSRGGGLRAGPGPWCPSVPSAVGPGEAPPVPALPAGSPGITGNPSQRKFRLQPLPVPARSGRGFTGVSRDRDSTGNSLTGGGGGLLCSLRALLGPSVSPGAGREAPAPLYTRGAGRRERLPRAPGPPGSTGPIPQPWRTICASWAAR